jgi:hypothetical protein
LLGSTAITANKTASFMTSSLAIRSHTITAMYVGDTNYVASTSVALTQVVNKAATTATLTLTTYLFGPRYTVRSHG